MVTFGHMLLHAQLQFSPYILWLGAHAPNQKLLPRLIQNETVEIRISFTLGLIQDFNDLTGEISFLGIFQMQWHEERFVWDPAQYGGNAEVLFPVDDVWKPELTMGNVEDDKKQPGRNAYRVRFSYDGTASMESLDYLQSFCHMDVREYPHDKQTCLYRGSYTSAHVLLNLLNELGKRDKM